MEEAIPILPYTTPFKVLERQGKNLIPYGQWIEFATTGKATAYIQRVSQGCGPEFTLIIFNMVTGEYPAIFKNGQLLPARFFLYRGQKLLASGNNEQLMTQAACHHSRQSPRPVTLHDEVHGFRHTFAGGREVFG